MPTTWRTPVNTTDQSTAPRATTEGKRVEEARRMDPVRLYHYHIRDDQANPSTARIISMLETQFLVSLPAAKDMEIEAPPRPALPKITRDIYQHRTAVPQFAAPSCQTTVGKER